MTPEQRPFEVQREVKSASKHAAEHEPLGDQRGSEQAGGPDPRMGPFERALDILRRECLTHYGERLISIVVFGSVGRQTARPDSDIDVLLVADPLPDGRMARVREFDTIEKAFGERWLAMYPDAGVPDLSPVFKTPSEVARGSLLFLDMVHDAWIVYDKDDFFARHLKALTERLESLGARRVFYRGSWYWDIKPDLKPGEVFEL